MALDGHTTTFLHDARAILNAAASQHVPRERAATVQATLDVLCTYMETGSDAALIEWAARQPWQRDTYELDDVTLLRLLGELDTLGQVMRTHLISSVANPEQALDRLDVAVVRMRHYYAEASTRANARRMVLLQQANQNLKADIAQTNASEEDIRQQNFELQLLYEIAQQSNHTLNYADLMSLIAENLHRALPYDVAMGLVLADEHQPRLICRTTQSLAPLLQRDLGRHMQTLLEQFPSPTGSVHVLPSKWEIRVRDPDAPMISTLQSMFVVPFLPADTSELFGLLLVGAHDKDAFSESQVRLIYTVANHAIRSMQHLRMLLASERRGLENMIRNLPVGVLMLDTHYRILLSNPVVDRFLPLLTTDRRDQPLTRLGERPIDTLLQDRQTWELKTATRPPRTLRLTTNTFIDRERHTSGWVLVLDDITERKQAEENIRHMALYDALTNLPNRVLFRDRLIQATAQAQRTGRLVAVMFLDMDNFKSINDTLGHSLGDQFLQIVAQRLVECVRATDTVARLGGDEFTVILNGIASTQDVATVAQKILDELSAPISLGERHLVTSASIGITFYPSDATDIDNLIKQADIAMYRAKNDGRNSYTFFTTDMHGQALEWLTLERDMRKAIDHGDFVLHYQPQINLDTRQISGVEALVRWQHPELGLLMPERFLPIAEEGGLMSALGAWVLRTACTQARAWQLAGLPPLHMAVNVSASQLAHTDLAREIDQILRETCLPASWLVLELKEPGMMRDAEALEERMCSLKALNVQITIDDFGTGFSSLGYLKRLPIDTLKIDRSFVQDIPHDEHGIDIAATIIAMARNLHLRVIAEGVEHECQEAFLREHGCHETQGHLYGKPIPATEMTPLLERMAQQHVASQENLPPA
jgi:diguanylate cyclase (GGDEF)-like protein